ncbi:MAG: antibiotic biosynthesis monooxygenase [Bacteroidetes bacterium]|nr:MAG: antibiotic biosynthesis monooxygenase [Bacteroidota bacterium]
MIKRIVKMVFRTDATDAFLHIFEKNCEKIRAADGCISLELVQSIDDPCIFFTVSTWEDNAALDAYRNSDVFRSTWVATKALFDDKPVAWSTESKRLLGP